MLSIEGRDRNIRVVTEKSYQRIKTCLRTQPWEKKKKRILASHDEKFQLCPRGQNLTSMPLSVLFTYLSVPLSETNKNPGSSQKKVGYLCQKREIFSLRYCCAKEENKNDKKKGTFTSCPQETTKLNKGRKETISGKQKKRSSLSSVNNVMYYLKQLYVKRIWEVNTIKFTSFSTRRVSNPQVILMSSKQSVLVIVLIVIHRKRVWLSWR